LPRPEEARLPTIILTIVVGGILAALLPAAWVVWGESL
jgi:hypothetical protein